MVIIKSSPLTSFASQKNDLVNLLSTKTLSLKVTTINKDIDNKCRAEISHVTELLNSIEAKFKKCETLYYVYFENADHGVLSGNVATLPIEIDCTLIDGTTTIKHYFKVDDRNSYKDIIDMNFQTFILTSASLYENLVLLAEIFLKKIIVYRKLLSSPLHEYINYLELLISLGYRNNDKLNACVLASAAYFDHYLLGINQLRNSFIHGFSVNLETDGFNYFVSKMDKMPFAPKSAPLQIDIFTKEVLDRTREFTSNLMIALKDTGKHYRKTIPA